MLSDHSRRVDLISSRVVHVSSSQAHKDIYDEDKVYSEGEVVHKGQTIKLGVKSEQVRGNEAGVNSQDDDEAVPDELSIITCSDDEFSLLEGVLILYVLNVLVVQVLIFLLVFLFLHLHLSPTALWLLGFIFGAVL